MRTLLLLLLLAAQAGAGEMSFVPNPATQLSGSSVNDLRASTLTVTGQTNLQGATYINNLASPVSSTVLPSTVAYTSKDNNWSAAQTFQATSTFKSAVGVVSAQDASALVLSVSSQNAAGMLSVTGTGNVGIGITSPEEKLHLRGSMRVDGAAEILWRRAGMEGWAVSAETGGWYVYNSTDSAYRFYIDTGGNVGIGTTSPGTTLDVNGGAAVRGVFDVVGGTPTFRNTNASGSTLAGLWNDTDTGTSYSVHALYNGSAKTENLFIVGKAVSGSPTQGSIATRGAWPLVLGVNNGAQLVLDGGGNSTTVTSSMTVQGAIAAGVSTATSTITGIFVLPTSQTPASGQACTAGTFTWDANYLYLCTASGVEKRVAITGGY